MLLTSKRTITLLVISLLCAIGVYAQQPVFTGKIIDLETRKGIDTAIITVLASGDTFFTNEKGEFAIPELYHSSVIISHEGYENLEMKLKKGNQTIYLLPTTKQLDELIIRKSTNINDIDIRNSTGSVITVDMTQLSQRSELNIAKLLEGQVAGLTVTYSGELGKKPEIRLRGNSSFNYQGNANEPLFIMDGIVISTETFMTLNPNDFSTIKVLKDAPATALYGIKAANGVIELTSKRGFDGKPIISYAMKQGITMRGERTANMMNTDEKLAFERRMQNPATPGYLYSSEYINTTYQNSPLLSQKLQEGEHKLDSLRRINTDWFKELVKPNYFQSHNLSVRGGTEKNSYFYSLNYSKQGGRIPGNDINQITARANLDYILAPNLTLSLNNSFGLSTTNTENGMDNDPTSLAFMLNPYETKHSTKLTSYSDRSYADLINQYKQKQTSKRFSSSMVMQWDILPELNIAGVIGADYSLSETYKRILSTAYSQKQKPNNAKGFISDSDSKNFDFTYNIRANYQKQLGDHDIFLGVNMDYYTTNTKIIGGEGHGIADDISSLSGINNSLTGGYAPKNSGSKIKNTQLGFGAALGYTYKGTYDVYGSFKRDGSSLLPSSKRWNDAWSTGIGWSPIHYDFFKNQNILTDLKFKASLGYTASMTGISIRDIESTFSNPNTFYGDYRLLVLQGIPNKDLKPQQTHSINYSVDFGFFERLSLLVNFYQNTTKDAILSMPIAMSNGFNTFTKNIGELENRGIEFMLSGDAIRLKDFRWNTSLSLSYNANKVKSLYSTDRIYLTEESVIPEYEVGKPLGIIYGLQTNGIHPLTGVPEYIDNDGHVIDLNQPKNANHFRRIGYSIAPYNGFFNNYFTYRNWALNININYNFGGKKMYSQSYVRDYKSSNLNAIEGQLQDSWFEVGDEDKVYPIKKLPSNAEEYYQSFANNRTIYKTDFIKLNYIQLSYNLGNNNFINKYFKSLQLSVQADNIYTYRFQTDRGSLNDVLQPILTFSLNATF
ncbi:SusC/RagA family TonB-linked outer membrane protein [Myroides odoratimimus]|uniref:SusC/RagA family TonB-linked outer membrane protein n=1 Tax=Myroides odoratimimus TaxID=76832 RepID=UPI002577BE8F|nr:SusC/RagA family TonB-linked outer membrane protein [Myroides odoratimimus]MDM1528118.1 SusC/RagA family TonB-linked outer membrane protein [Myroides odoratimimus]